MLILNSKNVKNLRFSSENRLNFGIIDTLAEDMLAKELIMSMKQC